MAKPGSNGSVNDVRLGRHGRPMKREVHGMMEDDFEAKAAALAEGLDRLLAEGRRPAGRRKKGHLVLENKDKILAMKAQGWTWDGIAQEFERLGVKVSARTLRGKVVGASPRDSGKKKRQGQADSRRQTSAKRPPIEEAQPEQKAQRPDIPSTRETAKPRSTAADFVTLTEGDL
jgi:hypothetical protein